jgi:hypothetical protein
MTGAAMPENCGKKKDSTGKFRQTFRKKNDYAQKIAATAGRHSRTCCASPDHPGWKQYDVQCG